MGLVKLSLRAPLRPRGRVARLWGAVGLSGLLAGCIPAPIQDRGYTVVFFDDFSGTTLGEVWATAPFGDSLPATVAYKVVTLKATAANDYSWAHIATTGPRSAIEPSYPKARAWQEGYFEARIRYTDDPWAWPAFWLFGMSKSEAWPGEDCTHLTAEWDIMENGVQNGSGTRPANDWFYTVLHRNTSDGTADGYCGQPDTAIGYPVNLTGTELSGWHIWSGYWDADELCTYIDEVQLHCFTPYDSSDQPMVMVLTMQYLSTCTGCPTRPSELIMQVDWVRVWQKAA